MPAWLARSGLAGSAGAKAGSGTVARRTLKVEPAPLPPLLTAIQEDLGLKLDARRRDVDVLVIDRIERPSEN